jgi:hypothetical protein
VSGEVIDALLGVLGFRALLLTSNATSDQTHRVLLGPAAAAAPFIGTILLGMEDAHYRLVLTSTAPDAAPNAAADAAADAAAAEHDNLAADGAAIGAAYGARRLKSVADMERWLHHRAARLDQRDDASEGLARVHAFGASRSLLRWVRGGGDISGGGDIIGDGDDGDVSVRSAEGEVVAWSRSAAARSAALANWVSDTGGAEGAFATLVSAAALRTLSCVAEGGAEDGGALEGCSLAQLAQLLHGAHFLDVDVELRRLLSRTLCTGHLAGKSGPELGRLLGVVSDFPTEAERQAATEEPIFTPDAQHNAPGAADAPIPPAPVCWLSTQLVNEDALEDALADADVPTLRALKGVSLAWRARARRVLCARLCARVSLPLTSNLVEVTELDLSDSRAAGRLFADAVDASRWLPNLAKVTGLGGVDRWTWPR